MEAHRDYHDNWSMTDKDKYHVITLTWGFPWLGGKEFACQCKRGGFDPWVGKITWGRKWQRTLAFLPRKFHGQRSPVGYSLCACVHANSLQSCPTLCNPMDGSSPGSSVHGILQARILEWTAMPSSRGSSLPRDQTHVLSPVLVGRFFTTSATWEIP